MSSQQGSGRGRIVLAAVLGVLVLAVSVVAGWLVRSRWSGSTTGAGETAPDGPLARGRLVYQSYCASCHGPEGHGDGPSAAELKPPPHDFAAGLRRGGTPADVRRAIVQGVPPSMPGAAALAPDDLDALTAYVLSLAPPSAAGPQSALRPSLERAGLTPSAGRTAPDLELLDAAGRRTTVSDRRGRLVLLVFWETGCIPCLEKLPGLERLAEDLRGQEAEVLPVCINEADVEAVRGATANRLTSLPAYRDMGGSARLRYGVTEVPWACLIDRDGRLLGAGPGPVDWTGPEARELLRACLRREG